MSDDAKDAQVRARRARVLDLIIARGSTTRIEACD
jgi:hypothetical protein